MGATEEERPDPRDYLVPGRKWVTSQRTSRRVGRTTRVEHISYVPGDLVEGRPQEIVLLQNVSMRLRKAIDDLEVERQKEGTDPHKWTLEKVADRSGVSLSTVNDLLQGKTWPKLETIATLELFFGENLWTHTYIQHLKDAKTAKRAAEQRLDEQPPSSDDSMVGGDP